MGRGESELVMLQLIPEPVRILLKGDAILNYKTAVCLKTRSVIPHQQKKPLITTCLPESRPEIQFSWVVCIAQEIAALVNQNGLILTRGKL